MHLSRCCYNAIACPTIALLLTLSPCATAQGDDLAARPIESAFDNAIQPLTLNPHGHPARPINADYRVALVQNRDEDRALSDGGAHGHHYDLARPDAHAPLGVMGDHVHNAGEIMLSYRFMYMEMDGNRDGDSRVSNADVLADFIVTPTDMTMEMHMLGVMYAPTDDVTLMAMLPYVRKAMNHRRRDGLEFKTVSDGIGDLKLSGLIKLFAEGPHELHANAGISVPTGSIAHKDATPLGRVTLPFPMQIGSGTVDLLPGVTYNYQQEQWSAGGQASGVIRLGRNHHGYSMGDQFNATAWGAYKWTDWVSTSLRLNYSLWGNYDGFDDDLPANPMFIPTARPDLRGGQRIDLLLGVNFYIREGVLKGHRFAVEGGVPLWQKLDGPQLETDWMVIVGWQCAF